MIKYNQQTRRLKMSSFFPIGKKFLRQYSNNAQLLIFLLIYASTGIMTAAVPSSLNDRTIDSGFVYTFRLKPSWHPGDSKTHRILKMECLDENGKNLNLGLEVMPSGNLVLAINQPKWIGGVVCPISKLWNRNEWQTVNCGWTPEKGFFLSSPGMPESTAKVPGGKALKLLKQVMILEESNNFSFELFHIGKNAKLNKGVQPEFPLWLFVPNGDWSAGTNVNIQCRASIWRSKNIINDKAGAFYLDCPQGIVPGNYLALNYDSRTLKRRQEPEIISDKNSLSYRYIYDLEGRDNQLELLHKMFRECSICLKSDLPPGTRSRIIAGYLDANGKSITAHAYPVTVREIPQVVKSEKFVVGMSITRADVKAQGDLSAFGLRLGLTFIDLWDYGYWIGQRKQEHINKMREEVKILRSRGLIPVIALHRALWEYRSAECKAFDTDGKTYPGESSRCPSERGKYHMQDLESVRLAAEAGAGISLDVEAYGLRRKHPCFCEICNKLFEQYRKETERKIDDTGARGDFTGKQCSLMIQAFYQTQVRVAKKSKQRQMMVIYDEGLWDSGCDLSLLAQTKLNGVELFMGPPLYHLAAANYRALQQYRKMLPQANVMPYIGCSYDIYDNDMISQVFAVLGGGAQGVLFWPWFGLSGKELVDIARALNAVAKVEDILTDGRELSPPKFNSDSGLGRIVQLGSRAMLLIGNDGVESKVLNVILPIKPIKCVNILSGETLLTSNTGSLRLNLPPNVFRMYELELE